MFEANCQVGRVPAVNILTYIYIYSTWWLILTHIYIYIERERDNKGDECSFADSQLFIVLSDWDSSFCNVHCVCVRLCMQSSGSLVLLRFRFVRPVSVKCEFFPASAF